MMKKKAEKILQILKENFSFPEWAKFKMTPFKTLIVTIISQNTTSRNTARAFENLSNRFEIEPAVLANAKITEIEECLKLTGLFRNKANAIKRVSQIIQENFGGNMDFILSLPLEKAREKLMELPGVGPKTADVVLLFSYGKPTFPIDTHINRVSKRLGLAPRDGDYETVRKSIQKLYKPKDYFALHILLIQLGRRYCKARNPLCQECPLKAVCLYKKCYHRFSMKIGYACINTLINCTTNSTFRLKSYSEARLIETIQQNLDCLKKILQWNVENKIYFFRIGSQLIPFASHPVCKFKWQRHFEEDFLKIGNFIKKHGIRVTMHPDQFIVLNSKNQSVVRRSISELEYHCQVLDLMKLPYSAKIVIHVGGVYGEKERSIQRFISNFKKLKPCLKKRLVIENDEKLYSLKDCLFISSQLKVPVIFDSLHHDCLNNKESVLSAVQSAARTWKKADGVPIVHYSGQKRNAPCGYHSQTVDLEDFKRFFEQVKDIECDIMLEVKDKEQSALKVLKLLPSIYKLKKK